MVKKISFRIDEKVMQRAQVRACSEGVTFGEFILSALKYLNYLKPETWADCLPGGWPAGRSVKSNSVMVPISESKFISKVKNNGIYSRDKTIEIALWNHVPYLKKQVPGSPKKRKRARYRCKDKNCSHTFIPENKPKCPRCNGMGLVLNESKKGYYIWKINNLLKYIQFGSVDVPEISDIDADILKRLLVKRLEKARKEANTYEKIPPEVHFTPIFDNVYPEWSCKNKAVVSFEDEGVFIGTVYQVRYGKVYIRYDDDKNDKDSFPIRGRITNEGGIVLGRAV